MMRPYWLMSLLVLFIGQTLVMEPISNPGKSLKAVLQEKKNHRRVLLLYGRDSSPGPHYLIDQQEALREVRDGLNERDLDVIVLVASEVAEPDRRFLINDFKLAPREDFTGWLIGKDGGIKQTFKKPVSANDLFRTIDSMPMRRQEMKH